MTVTYVCRCRSKGFRLAILFFVALAQSRTLASDFKFERETFAFQNSTVFDYEQGQIRAHKEDPGKDKSKRYTRRCFVMSRTTLQFHKFARFDPRGAPLDDKELAARVRAVIRQRPWHDPLPAEERIVFPGYPDLRAMSEKRGRLLQQNIGLGWPVYLRVGNTRMFYRHDEKYQEQTHANLEAALSRGDFFVAYLSSYPRFTINHSVLVYARKSVRSNNGIDHYLVYDPNHSDAPRELKWSPKMRVFNYQKDEEFVGGFTRAYQVYGKPWQ